MENIWKKIPELSIYFPKNVCQINMEWTINCPEFVEKGEEIANKYAERKKNKFKEKKKFKEKRRNDQTTWMRSNI